MAKLITVRGVDTSRGPNPVAVYAPIDKAAVVQSAMLVLGSIDPFELWQDVTWYYRVDPKASAIMQHPGANLSGATILLLVDGA